MGVWQTAPGYLTFDVRSKLGQLAHAAITVPDPERPPATTLTAAAAR